MNEQGMFKPALIGGVLLGVLSAIPLVSALNCFCCAWVASFFFAASCAWFMASWACSSAF